jgi:ribosomal protein S18 acetylase RimI-like enzyme
MAGLQQHSITRGSLEVTSDNSRAVQLYKRLGFHRYKTVYKTIKNPKDLKTKNTSVELAGMAEPAIF